MGSRGPKKRSRGQVTWRTDAEDEEAISADLAILRAARPGKRVYRADVLRLWRKNHTREAAIAHAAVLTARIDDAVRLAQDLQTALQLAQDELATYKAREAARADETVQTARALLAKASNAHLVQLVHDLDRLEASGLQAPTPNPVLQAARRKVTRWSDLLRDAP